MVRTGVPQFVQKRAPGESGRPQAPQYAGTITGAGMAGRIFCRRCSLRATTPAIAIAISMGGIIIVTSSGRLMTFATIEVWVDSVLLVLVDIPLGT